MGESGVLAHLHADVAGETESRVRGVDQAAHVGLRHARGQRAVDRLVRRVCHLRRQAHQLDLVGVLDHPAACRHRGRTHEAKRRGGGGDAVGKDERRRLLDADASRGGVAILQPLSDTLEGAFVLLPRQHIGIGDRSERELLVGSIVLEGGTHAERIGPGREDDGKQPFARAPADAGEVEQRAPAGQHDGIELVIGHQAAGPFDAPTPFIDRDWPGAILHRGQPRDRRRQPRCGAAAWLCGHPHHREAGHRGGQRNKVPS